VTELTALKSCDLWKQRKYIRIITIGVKRQDKIWLCSARWYSLLTPIYGQSLEIPKASGGRRSSRNNLHVGCESFLKKTMSEKSFVLLNILPVVMPTLRNFCDLDYLASLHLCIWQVDTGHVCKFVCFNIILQWTKH